MLLGQGSIVWDAPSEDNPVWAYFTSSGSAYYIKREDMEFSSIPAERITVWMRGTHERDKGVNYRRSIWMIHFSCSGYYRISAGSTYDANGKPIKEWDAYGATVSIRPDTMYASIERAICPSATK